MKKRKDYHQFTTHKKLHQKLMQKPGYKKEYDALESWFQVVKTTLELRERQGLTQAELAKRLNTTQPAIARFESGKYNPTVKFLDKLARALGKKLEIRFV